MSQRQFRVASFCSGLGGSDLGYQRAGAKIVYAIDIMKEAAPLYAQVLGMKAETGNICDIIIEDIPDFELMVSSYPAISWSNASHENMNPILDKLLEVLKVKQPRVFCFENVTSLLTLKKGEWLNHFMDLLASLGYEVIPVTVDGEKHVEAVVRQRKLFLVGVLKSKLTDEASLQKVKEFLNVTDVSNQVLASFSAKKEVQFEDWPEILKLHQSETSLNEGFYQVSPDFKTKVLRVNHFNSFPLTIFQSVLFGVGRSIKLEYDFFQYTGKKLYRIHSKAILEILNLNLNFDSLNRVDQRLLMCATYPPLTELMGSKLKQIVELLDC